MIKFNLKVTRLNIDTKRIRAEFDKQVRKVIHAGLRKFVSAAFPKVPVDYGMARGSLSYLGQLVGIKIPITPKKRGRDKYYRVGGRKILRTPEAGKLFFRPRRRSVETLIEKKGVDWTINFEIVLAYYEISSNSWGSFTAGERALIDHLNKELPKIKIPLEIRR